MTKEEITQERPPVVCIMGHIDHGKSTLLDYIRKTNIVDSEAGGITQKISAYEVVRQNLAGEEKKITFLDTPGHEAFGAIRSRGVEVADIAILVVSADDGVKKQTLEALHCIVASKLPYIVAINKIDKPGADIERTKMSLVENGIYLEGMGGDVSYVPISAKTGKGVDDLLNLLLLVAEMEELKGHPERVAEGAVIEATLDSKKGISATLIIKDGSIHSGDFVVCGDAWATTRMMEDFKGKKITDVTFSSPVRVIGFNIQPKVGTPFTTVSTKKEAEEFTTSFKETRVSNNCMVSDELLENQALLQVVIKAQNVGALEGIAHEMAKIKNDRVRIHIISATIGDITEGDVKLAASKVGTLLVGFDTKIDTQAKHLAERDGVEIKTFDIIYKLTEWLEEKALAITPKIQVEEEAGRAKILKVFSSVKDKYVLGGRAEEGLLNVGDDVKIMRQDVKIGTGKIKELQQQKVKTNEVRGGVEFGCMLQANIEVAPGDKIISVRLIEK